MKVFLLALFLMPLFALAQDHQNDDVPCTSDREKFCKGILPGGSTVMKCLREHYKKLTPACKAVADAMKAKVEHHKEEKMHTLKETREACGGDVEKFCKAITPGNGAIGKCLKEHNSELSEKCKSMLPAHQP